MVIPNNYMNKIQTDERDIDWKKKIGHQKMVARRLHAAFALGFFGFHREYARFSGNIELEKKLEEDLYRASSIFNLGEGCFTKSKIEYPVSVTPREINFSFSIKDLSDIKMGAKFLNMTNFGGIFAQTLAMINGQIELANKDEKIERQYTNDCIIELLDAAQISGLSAKVVSEIAQSKQLLDQHQNIDIFQKCRGMLIYLLDKLLITENAIGFLMPS